MRAGAVADFALRSTYLQEEEVARRSARMNLVTALAVTVSGCGSVLFAPYQEIRPVCPNVPTAGFSAPAVGAGCRSGQVMRLDRREDHVLEARANGYESATVRLESKVSVLRATVSILLNGLVSTPTLWIATPFLCAVDIRNGAWQVLEPGDVVVELYRPGQSPAPAPITPADASASAWPSTSPTPSSFCPSCGTRANSTEFCTSCGARTR